MSRARKPASLLSEEEQAERHLARMQQWSKQAQGPPQQGGGRLIGEEDGAESSALSSESSGLAELSESADRVYAQLRALSSPLFTLLPLLEANSAVQALFKRFLRKPWSSVYDDAHLELLADCVSLLSRDQRQAPHAIALMHAAIAAKPRALLSKVQTLSRMDRLAVITAIINQGGDEAAQLMMLRAMFDTVGAERHFVSTFKGLLVSGRLHVLYQWLRGLNPSVLPLFHSLTTTPDAHPLCDALQQRMLDHIARAMEDPANAQAACTREWTAFVAWIDEQQALPDPTKSLRLLNECVGASGSIDVAAHLLREAIHEADAKGAPIALQWSEPEPGVIRQAGWESVDGRCLIVALLNNAPLQRAVKIPLNASVSYAATATECPMEQLFDRVRAMSLDQLHAAQLFALLPAMLTGVMDLRLDHSGLADRFIGYLLAQWALWLERGRAASIEPAPVLSPRWTWATVPLSRTSRRTFSLGLDHASAAVSAEELLASDHQSTLAAITLLLAHGFTRDSLGRTVLQSLIETNSLLLGPWLSLAESGCTLSDFIVDQGIDLAIAHLHGQWSEAHVPLERAVERWYQQQLPTLRAEIEARLIPDLASIVVAYCTPPITALHIRPAPQFAQFDAEDAPLNANPDAASLLLSFQSLDVGSSSASAASAPAAASVAPLPFLFGPPTAATQFSFFPAPASAVAAASDGPASVGAAVSFLSPAPNNDSDGDQQAQPFTWRSLHPVTFNPFAAFAADQITEPAAFASSDADNSAAAASAASSSSSSAAPAASFAVLSNPFASFTFAPAK